MLGLGRGVFAQLVVVLAFAGASAACGGDDFAGFSSNPDGGTAASAGSAGSSGSGGSAGSSGASSGGSAGSGQGGSAGAGGAVPPEDCLNGTDDDGDGNADCADSECQADFTCAAPAPDGWEGVGFVDQSSEPCPQAFDMSSELYESGKLTVPPPNCTCGCGDPQGVGCGTHLYCEDGTSCSNSATLEGVGTGCSTYAVPNSFGSNACRAETPQAGGGTCAANVTSDAPSVTWEPSIRACGASSGGACKDGSGKCVPRLTGAEGPCIAQAGDVACPAEVYTQKRLVFDGQFSDTRSCTAAGCSCAAPKGGTCTCSGAGCQVQIFLIDACAPPSIAAVPANGSSCTTVSDIGNGNGNWGVRLANTTVGSPGSCVASGSGTPTGEVEPTGPITICCAP